MTAALKQSLLLLASDIIGCSVLRRSAEGWLDDLEPCTDTTAVSAPP